MSGELQAKIYGGHKHSSTTFKKMGCYNGPTKKLGCYNSAPKRLGVYTGVGSGKNNLNMEVYPRD